MVIMEESKYPFSLTKREENKNLAPMVPKRTLK